MCIRDRFHTFREHPYKVQDDKAMDDLVGTIKEHGIMTPATVRPEKDGNGYETVSYTHLDVYKRQPFACQ